MLQSNALSERHTLLQKTRKNNDALTNLQSSMKQRLNQLDFIQKLLEGIDHKGIVQKHIQTLEDQCQQSQQQLRENKIALAEKTRDYQRAQTSLDRVQASLDSLDTKYESEMEDLKSKYEVSQHRLIDTQIEHIEQKGLLERQVLQKDQHIDQLSGRNQQLETELKQQAEKLGVELQDQVAHLQTKLEHQLRTSKDELDHQKESNREIEKRLISLQSVVDEKDQMLETLKGRVDPQEHHHVLQQLEALKEENEQYKNQPHDTNQSREEFEYDKSKHSRIPVLSNRAMQQQHDLTKEINLMKDDLLLYQDKLLEKITQNKQLESAMERVNEHVAILQNSLNDTQKESAQRYENMMKYMEENRVLREQLER